MTTRGRSRSRTVRDDAPEGYKEERKHIWSTVVGAWIGPRTLGEGRLDYYERRRAELGDGAPPRASTRPRAPAPRCEALASGEALSGGIRCPPSTESGDFEVLSAVTSIEQANT